MHVQDDILKKRVLWGTVTWSKMGQQNIHAKKVYSHDCAKKIVPYRCLLPRLQQWMGSQLLWLANNRRRSLL